MVSLQVPIPPPLDMRLPSRHAGFDDRHPDLFTHLASRR